jgi:phosphatidylserine decarboxylase
VTFAAEGRPFIAGGIVLAVAAWGITWQRPTGPFYGTAVALTLVALWIGWFFRDPERTGARGPQFVIAPADGKVIMIAEVDEPTFMKQRVTRVSIFMNVFSVHVNRYPVSGAVKFCQYNPGKFLNAAAEKSSVENEQSSVGIEFGGRRILMRQIAGLIARRIITYSREGQQAAQGERMGLIRFGSRVDVFLPPGAAVKVRLGEHTVAGTTVVAEVSA